MNAPHDLNTPRAHARTLTDAQLAEYHDTGFLTLRNLFDPQLLARLTETTERLYEAGRVLTAKTKHYDLESPAPRSSTTCTCRWLSSRCWATSPRISSAGR
jgi:hypothetical protein